ncbi:NAD(P)-binding protein [Whalleya microplaca]|nr:NAD(P)-binding protein [Whalleya microplaca]
MPEFDFDPIKDVPELTGKVILLTGGTSGLGASVVSHLAKRNPSRIYFTGRNDTAAKGVIDEIRNSGSPTAVEFLKCDLASLETVKQVADTILARESRLDVLIANAGIMAKPAELTKDGYELHFGTNHLGHALLIRKLIPLLEKTASIPGSDVRIITVTSLAFVLAPRPHGIMFDELRTTQNYWILGPFVRYAQSKLANALYGQELARRYPSITTLVIDPGVSSTSLVESLPLRHKLIVWISNIGKFLKPEQGPLNCVWAVGVPKERIVSRQLYEPVGLRSSQFPPFQLEPDVGQRLWDWTDRELERFL